MSGELSLDGLRILIVDDEFLIAMNIEALVEDSGGQPVGPASDIPSALAIIKGEPLDGALLDANLNGASSEPIALALQAAAIPFVVITGYGRLDLDGVTLSAAPRLTKPIVAREFEVLLTQVFGAATAARRARIG